VAASEISFTRTAGLSQRKAEYIKGLAEKFSSGELSAQKLVDASDEELLEMLIAVRGLGRWSVEMFAFFALKRMDIFSTGDLGVQRGVAKYMGRDVEKLKNKGQKGKWKYATEAEMLAAAEPFAPYRFEQTSYERDRANRRAGVCLCGICGALKTSTLVRWTARGFGQYLQLQEI
jgi:DNA-3-methyladenine glycosylase II